MLRTLVGFLVVAGLLLCGPSGRAETDLPWMPVAAPEAAPIPDAAADLINAVSDDILDAVLAVADPPSTGWIGPQLRDISALLDAGAVRVAALSGPNGRAMAEYLARNLSARRQADGWDAMARDARRAVAMERQLSANAVFWGHYFPDSFVTAATANQTEVLTSILFDLTLEAEVERELGQPSPTRSEELAFRLAQAGFTGETAMAAVRPIRRDPGIAADAALNRRVHDLEALIAELTTFNDLVAGGMEFPDPDAVLTSADTAVTDLSQGFEALMQTSVDLAAVYFPSALGVGDIQRSLNPDEAVVMIVPATPDTLIFAVTRDAFQMRTAGAEAVTLWEAADRLRTAIGRPLGRGAMALDGDARPPQPDVLRAEAARIYDGLLRPVEAVLQGKPRLFVVATAQVGLGFPFEMLLTEPALPGQADAELAWLVRRHAVTVVPTLELIRMRDTATAPVPEATYYLGFGGPDYRFPSQLGRTNRATRLLSDLAPLPDAAEEVRAVAAAFGPDNGLAVTGVDATENLLLEVSRSGTLRQFTVLHFATHGLVFGDHEAVTDPLLALTPMIDLIDLTPRLVGTFNAPTADGILEAHEVRQLDLAARLVILSACSSGNAGMDEDGLTSLGAAFLAAGADRVLGTHWPIYSDAAVEIVTGMAARDPRMADPAMALRDTLVQIIDGGGRRADPAWWAAFSLVGQP